MNFNNNDNQSKKNHRDEFEFVNGGYNPYRHIPGFAKANDPVNNNTSSVPMSHTLKEAKQASKYQVRKGMLMLTYGYIHDTNEFYIQVFDGLHNRVVYENRTALGMGCNEFVERLTFFGGVPDDHITLASVNKPI